MINFFSKNNFGMALSIDGGKIIQNTQRPLKNGSDSFYESTKYLPYIFDKISNVHVRGTYINLAIPLEIIYTDLLALGFKEISLPLDILGMSKSDIELLIKRMDNLTKYIINYISTHEDFPFSDYIVQIRRLFIPKINNEYGCGLGENTLSIDTKGNIYPCHRYSSIDEVKMGYVLDNNPLINVNSIVDIKKDRCKFCWNQYTCSHGCSYNDYANIDSHHIWCSYSKKNDRKCNRNIIISKRITITKNSSIAH